MTLNVVALHNDGILLAADRRLMERSMRADFKATHHLLTFWDGIEKVFIPSLPHSWVAFTGNGRGTIFDAELVKEFENSLPDSRLDVREYAALLNRFCRNHLQTYPLPKNIDTSKDRSNIVVAGFDAGSRLGKVFTITPELDRVEERFTSGGRRIFFGGESGFVGAAINGFADLSCRRLLEKQRNAQKIGLCLSRRETQLLNVLFSQKPERSEVLWSKQELMDLAAWTIGFVADQLKKPGRYPSVSSDYDLVWVSADVGAQFVHNHPNDSALTLSDTNLNHISIQCCGENVLYHLPVYADETKPEHFQQIPADGWFRCPRCGDRENLNLLIDDLRDDLSDEDD